MQFWDTSFDYSKATKVLVIPNITNYSDIDKDSFIDVLCNQIESLNKRGNFYWYVIVPYPSKRLNLDNVKQLKSYISGDMIKMRTTMPIEIVSYLEKIDYDVVYSHLPDWYAIGRYTDKKIIGYSHWWELSTCNAEDRKNHARNLVMESIGALRMSKCYLNTQDQKNRVLEEAKEWLSVDMIKQLDDKLVVWNLGMNRDNIVTELQPKENIIVFNHRAAAYKGYPDFIKLMEEYRLQRQDFKVWVPQLKGTPEFDWIDNTKLPKWEYYNQLGKCKVGIQMRQSNYGWSVAATDCMMNGTPMIFQESDCYREIQPDGLFFKYKKDLFSTLDKLLDDTSFLTQNSLKSIQRCQVLCDNDNRMIGDLHNSLVINQLATN